MKEKLGRKLLSASGFLKAINNFNGKLAVRNGSAFDASGNEIFAIKRN